jgi:hypothetical protein
MPSALIVGHSQAGNGATGQALAKLLSAQGWQVDRHFKSGATTGQIRDMVAALPAQGVSLPVDLAVVFANKLDASAVDDIVQRLSGCGQIVWYGAPPATRIKNLSTARAVFSPSISSADHWFTSGEADAREADNAKMSDYFRVRQGVVPYHKITYVDWRKLSWQGATLQPNGVLFPDLVDGIHVTGSVAQQAVNSANWPPKVASVGPVGLGLDWRWVTAALGGVYLIFLWRQSRRGAA